jgi:Putative zinc-finger
MNCRRVEQLLSDHLEGLLSTREAGAVVAHLGNCPTCRRLHDEILAAGSDLRALAEPLPHPDLRRRTVARWRAECAATAPNRRRGLLVPAPPPLGRRTALGAAAGTVLVAVLGLAWWSHGRNGEPSGIRSTAPAPRGRIASALPSTLPLHADRTSRGIAREQAIPPGASSPSQPAPRQPQAGLATARRGGHRSPILGLQPVISTGDDLARLNGDAGRDAQRWASPSADEWGKTEARVRSNVPVQDDFVRIPFPQIAAASDRQIAGAVESYKREAAIVDPRLAREVTLQQKATALSDLCDGLRADTGIQLYAGRSVEDEKVTLFCRRMPLRDVMRQLSRPFGYTWLRSGLPSPRGGGAGGRGYRYELTQDLRSQLLEEELRNRDRNEALLSLDREIEKYRPYLGLSPDEALARSKTARPAEKRLLETLAGSGWGVIQMYFRLSAQDQAALRSGQPLYLSGAPEGEERLLPPEVARGTLQSLRDWRVVRRTTASHGDVWIPAPDSNDPAALPLTSVSEVRATVSLAVFQSELGQFTLNGESGYLAFSSIPGDPPNRASNGGNYVSGTSPAALEPENEKTNARLAQEATMRVATSVVPRPSCYTAPDPEASPGSAPEPKVTTGDVLEALHRATGLPIVADFYTRLYKPAEVTRKNQPLLEALNSLTDAMRLRWSKEASWLRFRSASYYHDRLKEVPNRLLTRWAAARRQRGALTIDDLCEIAQLPDAQLDARSMREGARDCYGLQEWRLASHWLLRRHLRFLAGFTPAQRQEAMSTAGLPFTKMSLAQQQQFMTLPLNRGEMPLWESLEGLGDAALRVDYTQPGWYEWRPPGMAAWVPRAPFALPVGRGPHVKRLMMPHIRERTREAALEAARRLGPQIRQALLQRMQLISPQIDEAQMVPQDAQITATRLGLAFAYIAGTSSDRNALVRSDQIGSYTE